MKKRIAIQGIKGSNHHQVALEYFGEDSDLVESMSFDYLVDRLLDNTADLGIMAIENSIAGSIIPNYALIYHNNLSIIGEHYLNIDHNLMVLHGQTMTDIEEVRSHPMALLQCKAFFREFPHIKLVEDVDTAETAKRIQDRQLKHVAAIAPKVAAVLYDLNIVSERIQTIKNNATRFIIVSKKNQPLAVSVIGGVGQKGKAVSKTEISKASIRFVTDHKRGSLAAILNVMSDCDLNLTKIQSLPIIETPWKYAFFVDVTFAEYERFQKAKALLGIMSEDFTVLGEYKHVRL